MKRIALAVALLGAFCGYSQNTNGSASWEENPKLHALTPEEMKEGAVTIIDERIIDYDWWGTINGRDEYKKYYSRHVIVHLNTDKAVEDFNKVYIPMDDENSKSIEIKARSIAPDGKVVDMKEEDVKELSDYEGRGRYILFAINGVQKGGEIEYSYKIRHDYKSFGSEYRRSSYPCRKLSIKIQSSSPKLLVGAQGYNGLKDSESNLSNSFYYYAENLKGTPREEYSAGDAELPRVEYKTWRYIDMSKPYPPQYMSQIRELADGPRWKSISNNIWENTHNMTAKQLRKARKSVKSQRFDTIADMSHRIRAIENYVKTHYAIKPTGAEDEDHIDVLLRTKVSNATGITRLYMCLFEAYGIKYRLAITSNRFAKRFDTEFATYAYLQDYLFYFPDAGEMFMSPSQIESKFGFPPEEYISNEALCFANGNYYMKTIPVPSWEKNQSNITADIRFDFDEDVVNGKFEMKNTGYFAASYQLNFLAVPSENDRQRYLSDILDSYSGKDQPKNTSVSGTAYTDLFYTPCVLKMDYTSSALLEKAGQKYIFHVGEVIGPQNQLYSDTARVTGVDLSNQHGFLRTITLHIPEGYKVTNPDALNMDVHHDDNGKRTAEFLSSYKLEGDLLTISVQETYRQLRYPVSQYEEFRKVINAAADFNKIVLFLEKK